MGVRLERQKEKITLMAILLAGSCFLTYYFHEILETGTIFTHLYYIPIILASLWWKRKGLAVSVFLTALLIFSHHSLRDYVLTANDYLRAFMFVTIGLVVAFLSERIAKTEQMIRKGRDYLDNLFNYANAPIIVWDPDSRITRFNNAFEHMTGLTAEEVIGQELSILFPEASRDNSLEKISRTLSGEYWESVEIPILCKDGDIRVALWNSANIYAEDGETIVATISQGTEISQRKRAEEELEFQRAHIKSLFDYSGEAMALLDLENHIIDANLAFEEVFGYPLEEAHGKVIEDLICPERITTTDLQGNVIYTSPRTKDILGYDQEAAISKKGYSFYGNGIEDAKLIMKELKAKGELKDHEMKLKRKDDELIDINLSASLLKDEKGEVIGTLGIYRDITEKNMLEVQLAQAQRMEALGTLAGGIAHNFNNLLMGIQGNASLMLLETDPAHPNYQKLKTIEKSVQSGSTLTRQLLGYAREGKYEIKPISLNQLVKETSDTFSMTKKEIRIHQEFAKDLFGIKADQGQIEQVLLNIYVNASDAMPAGGDLFLKTINVKHKDMKNKSYKVKSGNYVLLTIRDTGTGMDKKTMKRIFEPFFTTKGLAKGTGLGLASTYGIIKAHGGYIDVDSEKGQGTTFSIYLPASKRKVEEVAKDAGQIIKGDGSILLVDDEEIVLDVGVQLLKVLGYTVLEAKGGREAVEIYRENKDRINMVLLDMVMPDMGGGEVYDKMKEVNPDIKVLLSSGYSIDGRAEEILERGCNGFIQKPFNMKGISGKIREILDKG